MATQSSRVAVMALAMAGAMTLRLDAQTVTAGQTRDAVTVHAPGLGFIKGEPLARLKDGRALRVDLELSITPGPGGAAAARGRRTFILSYDLWEERFAVSLEGSSPRSVAYLTASGAEAWCLEQLTVPIAELGRLGRDAPFWIRLEYRIADGETAPSADDGLTLRSLIETFSRKPRPNAWTHAVEAGPFRLHS